MLYLTSESSSLEFSNAHHLVDMTLSAHTLMKVRGKMKKILIAGCIGNQRYKLHWVTSPPSTFNLSMVQEFNANVSSKFSDSGGEEYVHGVLVHFDSTVINSILVNPSLPLVKNQVSKFRLKLFSRIWSDFIRRNFLGTSNNGNLTLELMNLSDVMCAAAHGDLHLLPSLSVSRERKIVYLYEINSLRRQFVEFQSSMCQTMSLP
ncbi:hypothetical protein DVH24_027642 [Malus domestica]|uniref:Uncharacterized protein n=1 Tax=Malus domestica TaxID=3750 RepID=A0A498HDI4_MALDO|nr:hypothetical protein DVH24_027642 [Malus domestica]